jgi:gliding motility-associated-like protein/uncharacterized repeat protein (TIGR02543 family)
MKKLLLFPILMLLGLAQGYAQIFSQNFNSSSNLADYAALSPTTGVNQFTAFTIFTPTNNSLSISNGRLLFAKVGNGGSSHIVRNADFAVTPKFLTFKVLIDFQDITGTLATSNIGILFGKEFLNDATFPDATKCHTRFGISTRNGVFTINTVANSATATQWSSIETSSQEFSGAKELSVYINNTGNTQKYSAPNGTIQDLENNRYAVWVGNVVAINNQPSYGPGVDLKNFRISFNANGATTTPFSYKYYFDDFIIYNESSLPLIVSFNTNGGTTVSDIYASQNQTITSPAPPTRNGYTFAGWFKDTNLTAPWNFATDVVTAATTLFAKWNPILYTVTFSTDGGTAVAPVQVGYNNTFTAPAAPTKTDVIFGGWYKDAALTTAWNFTTDVVVGNTILYAKWNDPRQSITFPAITDKVFGEVPFPLSATASSGLPVTYTALTNNITINGSIVTITNTGLATIRASQAGNANYTAAPAVEVSFTINKAPQTITFNQQGPFSRYAGVVTLNAVSSSGLPVAFTASNPVVGIITTDNKLQVKALGTLRVTASQAGNEFYLPAVNVERDVVIHTAGTAQLLISAALSPNGDGVNDSFLIEGINAYPENEVRIVTRSGNLVYEQKGYDNDNIVFSGKTNNGDQLPSGTYYYSLRYKQNGEWLQKKGYFVLRY